MMTLSKLRHVGAAGAALVLASPAVLADPVAAIDVTDITGTISNQLTSMTAIQVALLGALGLVVAFSLIKRAISR